MDDKKYKCAGDPPPKTFGGFMSALAVGTIEFANISFLTIHYPHFSQLFAISDLAFMTGQIFVPIKNSN